MINDREAELAREIQKNFSVPKPDSDIEVDDDWELTEVPTIDNLEKE